MEGDDPYSLGAFEVQQVNCSLSSGTFALTFRDKTTASIAYDASAATVKAALEALTRWGHPAGALPVPHSPV